MKVSRIIRSFVCRGYSITRSLSSGKIIVTNSMGFFASYDSYAHAYRSLT